MSYLNLTFLILADALTVQGVGAIVGLFLAAFALISLVAGIAFWYYWGGKSTEQIKDDLARARDRAEEFKSKYEEEKAARAEDKASYKLEIAIKDKELTQAERRLENCEQREEELRKKDLRWKGEQDHE